MGEEQKEEETPEIVLKVDMHCEGCAKKVERALRKFEGVEEVTTDSKLRKVVVKGKKGVDPLGLCDRLQKKTGRRAEVISPLPPQPQEEEKNGEAPPPPEEIKEEPKPITVVLKVRMHCEACAQVLQKRIKKMEGVESVETDISNEKIIVKGFVDPSKLVENVYRRTRRLASIVQEEEEKKEEDKGENDMKIYSMKMEYWHPKNYSDYAYAYPPPQVFSDENPNACSIM